jgi:3-keto-disaccharide hydrolase
MFRHIVCTGIAISIFSAWPTLADDPKLSTEEKGAGFELLFNGTDLTGWEEVQGKPGTFSVRDGVLTGIRKGDSAYWLSTVAEYGDFELRLQFKIPPKGNSGVFIRAPHEGRTSQKGMEIQIYDEPGKSVPDKGSTGSIYQVVPAQKFAHHPPGEWNDLWILCDGDRVKVTINGEVINDAKTSEYESLKDRPRKGFIGLSAHTDAVDFRNIRLRRVR